MGIAFDKESINIVERLQESHRLQPLTVFRGVINGKVGKDVALTKF